MMILSLLLVPAIVGFGLGDITDIVESDDFQTATDVAGAFYQAGRGISDSEEYYLGRAVAANVLSLYSPAGNTAFSTYLNSVGTWVGTCSPVPCTYGGWHFQLLQSNELNAFACPGGLIFITTGLLAQVRDEDELACVLAHEVAHVTLRHGVGSVQQSRWVQAFSLAGMEGAERLGSDELQQAADSYGDVVTDITESLITKGYSRESETSADSLAVIIAASAGYDPAALARVLDRMADMTARSGPGFWQTHPSPEDRMEALGSTSSGQTGGYELRKARFVAAVAAMGTPDAQPPSQGTSGRGTSGSRGGSSGGTSGGSSGGSRQ